MINANAFSRAENYSNDFAKSLGQNMINEIIS